MTELVWATASHGMFRGPREVTHVRTRVTSCGTRIYPNIPATAARDVPSIQASELRQSNSESTMLPQYTLDRFARIPHDTPIDNKYYGVFYQILQAVCFSEHHFDVEPRYPFPDLGVVDSVFTYVVEVNDLPVFFLEIKSPLHIDLISTRVDTDAEMRARFLALYEDISTPRLHGVSAMGQRLAFYHLDKETSRLTPSYIAPSPNTDAVPVERWDTDITTEDGYQRFMAVINDVKEMAAALL